MLDCGVVAIARRMSCEMSSGARPPEKAGAYNAADAWFAGSVVPGLARRELMRTGNRVGTLDRAPVAFGGRRDSAEMAGASASPADGLLEASSDGG
jgi:hypothetical protein